MIVIDASAMIEVLLRTPAAESVEQRIFGLRDTIHAPHLLDVEVAQVLRKYSLAKDLADSRGREALDILADFPLRRHSHEMLLERVWQLRNNLSAYDAVYVSLAEALEGTLITCDKRLAGATGHNATIELVR